ncbi:uncharacterized protein LOC112686680 [Sipha flava]|uniref:Uncharacterized protein LOC112686680 n=1 Tax=Sipha flava TaxID=143950 RepID=A0A2S2QMT4_9HEMI|nr:uncharacterized protein LOC112686680 [Sipha flava]
MKPFRPILAFAVVAAVATCAAREDIDSATAAYDDDDDDDRSDVADDDRSALPAAVQRDDVVSNNKCNDPRSGYKYKVGVTWYPEGCVRRSCFYSLEHKTALVRTEKCKCKECPPGMECSTVQRAATKDAHYPQCCPMTVCVPAGRTLWAFFKPNNWKVTFSKMIQNT